METLKPYRAAEPDNDIKAKERKFFLQLLVIFLKSIPLVIIEFLRWIFIRTKPKNISGQLALITGGSNGIGKSIAIKLAKKGCNIAIANRNIAEGERTAQEIEQKFGVRAKAFKADVSKPQDVANLKVAIENSLGPIDILVNNAGLLALTISFLEGTDEELQQIIDVNLTSHFWTLRQFLPGMIERKRGHIVAVSSISSKVSSYKIATYMATKHGNDGLMEGLYNDLCLQNHDEYIKVTTVFPAFIATQKKLQDMLSIGSKNMPLYDSDECGEYIVDGVLKNRREFIVPPSSAILLFFNYLPDRVMKWAKLSLVDMSKMELFEKKRNEE